MMKMATREGFPPPVGCRNGLDWFLVATEARGGGTPDLGFFLEVWGYIRGVGVGNKSRGSSRRPRGRGARRGVGRAPHPRGGLETLLAHLRYSVGFFWSKNDLREISGQLDSVWFSFSAILKNKEKTETGSGLWVNRLVPKII